MPGENRSRTVSAGIAGMCIAILVSACNIKLQVSDHGRVTTESGDYTCRAGKTCTIEVRDTDFDETFIARPDDGYAFNGWVRKPRGLCGGNYFECDLYTTGFAGNDDLMAILNSDQDFFLAADFAPIGNNRVTLGPLAGATVKAYTFDDLENPVETHEALRTRQNLAATGTFSLALARDDSGIT